ncbi:hypothetical protein P691DRAFT_811266 [Macrolepiota fuliginosa MF-IS2]|uniref:Uncharacterized protein n=1 Tax=Macrolepiota fuliginosa MF-IS2 TaxID=1400762 RepID=A0A9P6C5Q3_9AGAR|nr:hypothetical protein P691DRAFT_811266 [Macrolepiota fuliginosa MF-IS2]
MSDPLMECCSGFCGICCVAISSTISQWSSTSRAGSTGLCCCGSRYAGCCGSCCNDRFNEDNFEDQVRNDMAKTRDPNVPVEQPKASPEMAIPSPNSEPKSQDKAQDGNGETRKDEKEEKT